LTTSHTGASGRGPKCRVADTSETTVCDTRCFGAGAGRAGETSVRFCINPITFGDPGYVASLEAAAAGGFDAVELWLPHVERYIEEGHSAVLDDKGLRPAGACFVANLLTSTGEAKREAFDLAKARFELCQALGAKTIVCVADGPQQPTPDDYSQAAEQAREVGDLASSFGLTVGLEFGAGAPFVGTLTRPSTTRWA